MGGIVAGVFIWDKSVSAVWKEHVVGKYCDGIE
jgi:hypothetical protein